MAPPEHRWLDVVVVTRDVERVALAVTGSQNFGDEGKAIKLYDLKALVQGIFFQITEFLFQD